MALLLRHNTAEGGTNGVTVTTANSGGASGDAFTSVTTGAGRVLEFDSDGPYLDTLSYRVERTIAGTGYNCVTWGNISSAETLLVARAYFYRTAHPPDGGAGQSAVRNIIQQGEYWGADGASLCLLPTTGYWNIHNYRAEGSVTGIAMPLDQWIRFELEVEYLDAAGNVRGRMYNASGTLLESLEILGVHTGDELTKYAQYGWNNTVAPDADNLNTPMWMDDLGWGVFVAAATPYGWGINMRPSDVGA
jgi:hypothetical protein